MFFLLLLLLFCHTKKLQKRRSFAREIKYRLKLVMWAIIIYCWSNKPYGLSADWGSKHLHCVSMEIAVMLDNGRYILLWLW